MSRLKLQLTISGVKEQITVSAKPSLLQTENATLGRVIDHETIVDLPLVDRNFTEILGLTAGTNTDVVDATQLGAGSQEIRANGARSGDNNFMLNGVDANSYASNITEVTPFGGAGIPIPAPDTIQEFKVQNSLYDAQYGRGGGANVNVETRSGTTNLHGNASVNHEYISKNPISAWKSVKLDTNDLHVSEDRIIRPKVYARIMKAVDEVQMTPVNRERVKACMRLQREAGLAIVDAVGLSKDELTKKAGRFRVKTSRQKTGTSVNNPITEELGRLVLRVKNSNRKYFFASGNTLPEDAPSYFQKLYRKVFKKAGVEHTSHDLRHTYAATFLEAGGDIRLLSKALGHSSIMATEKYYAHFTTKQQDMLDKAAEKALAAMCD